MIGNTLHFTLRHFKRRVIDNLLENSGYTSLSMYEVETHNPLYELEFNPKTGLFTYVDNVIPSVDSSRYYSAYVSMSYLNDNIKSYLYHTYIKHYGYTSFDQYYTTFEIYLPKILVCCPYNHNLNVERLLTNFTMKFSDNKIYLKGTFMGVYLTVCNYDAPYNVSNAGYEFPLNYRERLLQLGVKK
jgi:hypothetical protein